MNNFVLTNLLSNIELNPREGDQLMHHPLLESFILRKWQKVKILFNIQFLITIFFVVAFSIFTIMKCLSCAKNDVTKDVHSTLGVVVIPLLVEIILVEAYLLLIKRYLYWMKGLLKATSLILAIVNICLFSECTNENITRDVIMKFYILILMILIIYTDIGLFRTSCLVLPLLCDQHQSLHWYRDSHLSQGNKKYNNFIRQTFFIPI